MTENNELDEVVVVGYGTQKKINLTGSVPSLNADKIETRNVSSVSAAIAGTMPGVTAIQNSGAPGSQTASVTIRGKNSINAASPLVIVDGVPGSMNNIDPQDIENISVLKDAASSAIYGVQAANGVIVITTKKGKRGMRPQINYSGSVSWTKPTARLKFLQAGDYARLFNEATLNDNPSAAVPFSEDDIKKFYDGSDPIGHPNTDWWNTVFKRSALETAHNVSINGGDEYTTYMASIGYLKQNGLTAAKTYERFNGRVNLESKLSRWLTFGINASEHSGLNNDGFVSVSSVLQHVTRIPPTFLAKDADGNFVYSGMDNPLAELEGTGSDRIREQQLNGTAYLKFDIFDGFSVKALYNLRNDKQERMRFKKHYAYGTYDSGKREGYSYNYDWNWYTTQLLANYDKTFGAHHVAALLGYEGVEYTYRYTTASRVGGGNNDLDQSLNTLDASTQKNSNGGHDTGRRSYFGRAQYDYLSKYLFELNFRADASSRFPKDNRWGYFPALSAGWRISEESFIKDNAPWVSNLKIRLGWGKTGNEEISDNYPAVATYAFINTLLGGALYSTAYESRYVNTKLKWATVTNYEFGLEGSFFNSKLGFELAVYKKVTNDMLLNLPILGVIGMDAPAQNAGSVKNTGFDFTVWHNNRINEDWSYNVSANVAYIKNTIVDLKGQEGADPKNDKYWRIEGYPIGSFYGYVADGFFNSQEEVAAGPKRTGQEKPGDIRYKDFDGDNKITGNDRKISGKNFPSWTAGLNIGVQYRDWDLSMLWQGAFDVDAYYTGEAAYSFFNSGKVLERHLDRWTPDHRAATYPRLSRNNQINYSVSSFWLQDASYVRLKNITLGYTLPKAWSQKIGMQRLKLYISGENLFTITGLDGLDPESPSDTRGNFYSNVKKIAFGVKVTF